MLFGLTNIKRVAYRGEVMQYLKYGFLLLLVTVALSLAGCGGSSSSGGTVGDPMASSTTGGTTTPPPTGSGTVLSYKLTLSTTAASGTGTTVGPNSTVIATAILEDSNGNSVANQPILFEAVEGPVTITNSTISTDSNGNAINFLRSGGTTTSAVDVILKASTSVNGQQVTSLSIFKIQRSESNVIKFITTKNPTDPDGTLNTLAVTVENQPEGPPNAREILQLVPFEILDNNGIPRTRVPVKISIYSKIGCPDIPAIGAVPAVFIDSPETVEKTVTTDDSGIGIFNVGVTIAVPPVGSQNACSIIYKAEAVDMNDPTKIIFAYGGFIASLTNLPPQ